MLVAFVPGGLLFAQLSSSGRWAFWGNVVASTSGAAAFYLLHWWNLTDDQEETEMDALRSELAALRLSTAMDAADGAALPPPSYDPWGPAVLPPPAHSDLPALHSFLAGSQPPPQTRVPEQGRPATDGNPISTEFSLIIGTLQTVANTKATNP